MSKPTRRRRVRSTPPVDRGTPEGQARRTALVGEADPALAAYPLGAMLARQIIDREQHDAGLLYARAWTVKFGSPWPSTNDSRSPASDRELAKWSARLEAMDRALTCDQRVELVDVAAMSNWPNWFFARQLNLKPLPEDDHERELLLSGLAALLGRHQRRAA